MKYYHRRIFKDQKDDIVTAAKFGMPDTPDAIMSSKEFTKWSKHLISIVQSKNTDYVAIGILDMNDLIQECRLCFLEAYSNLDWDKINEVPEPERAPMIWGYIKKTIKFRIDDRIRQYKDGIKVPHREFWADSYKDHKLENGAEFDAITTMFPQLDLEMHYSKVEISETPYWNDVIQEILSDHFDKYLGIHTKRRIIFEQSLGIDCDKSTAEELGERFDMNSKAVQKTKERCLKILKSEESIRELAFVLDGRMVPTGANILGFLENNENN